MKDFLIKCSIEFTKQGFVQQTQKIGITGEGGGGGGGGGGIEKNIMKDFLIKCSIVFTKQFCQADSKDRNN